MLSNSELFLQCLKIFSFWFYFFISVGFFFSFLFIVPKKRFASLYSALFVSLCNVQTSHFGKRITQLQQTSECFKLFVVVQQQVKLVQNELSSVPDMIYDNKVHVEMFLSASYTLL